MKPRFDSAGVKLIAVGVGTPDKAQILADRVFHSYNIHQFPCYKSTDYYCSGTCKLIMVCFTYDGYLLVNLGTVAS